MSRLSTVRPKRHALLSINAWIFAARSGEAGCEDISPPPLGNFLKRLTIAAGSKRWRTMKW